MKLSWNVWVLATALIMSSGIGIAGFLVLERDTLQTVSSPAWTFTPNLDTTPAFVGTPFSLTVAMFNGAPNSVYHVEVSCYRCPQDTFGGRVNFTGDMNGEIGQNTGYISSVAKTTNGFGNTSWSFVVTYELQPGIYDLKWHLETGSA